MEQLSISFHQNPENQEGYRRPPLKKPTYACYLHHYQYCCAGQNSIDRYLEATGFDAEIIEKDTYVRNECCFGRDLTLHSKKIVKLPIQIPNCEEFFHVPVRVLENNIYGQRDIPILLGRNFEILLREFATRNTNVKCPTFMIGQGLCPSNLATRTSPRTNIVKRRLFRELDPYPRENCYSKVVEGKLRIADVTRHLKEGICYIEFLYASSNGINPKTKLTKLEDIRRMYATKCANFIPDSNRPSNPNPDRFDESAIRVFDVEISEWRSFKVENIIIFRVKRESLQWAPNYGGLYVVA